MLSAMGKQQQQNNNNLEKRAAQYIRKAVLVRCNNKPF